MQVQPLQDDPSSHFEQPAAVSAVNEKKFVSHSASCVLDGSAVTALITSINAKCKVVVSKLKVMQDALWFRSCSSKDIKNYSITLEGLERDLAGQVEQVYGTIGLQKKIPVIRQIPDIPNAIVEAKALEIELMRTQKSLIKTKSICECKAFRKVYAFRQQVMLDLASFLKIEIAEKAQKVLINILEKSKTHKLPNGKRQIRAINELFLDIFQLSLFAANKRLLRFANVFGPQIKELKDCLQKVKECLRPNPQKLPPNTLEVAGSPDILNQMLVNPMDVRFSFWSKAPKYTWISYTAPYWGGYTLNGDYGQKLEQEVGQPLSCLISRVEARIPEVARGSSLLDDELAYYCNYYYLLKRTLAENCTMLEGKPFDALHETVVNYISFLEQSLKRARSAIMFFRACSQQPVLGQLKAIIKDYARPMSAAELFPSANALVANQANWPKDEELTTFDAYIKRTANFVYEVHAQKIPEILQITPQEQLVARAVLVDEPLEPFYAGESALELPRMLMSYIVKRAERYLLLPLEKEHVEFELVLCHIRTDENLKHLYSMSLLQNKTYKELIDAYDADYKEKRFSPEKVLQPARRIAKLNHAASTIIQYAKVWQKMCQFYPAAPLEIQNLLLDLLKTKGKPQNFPFLYPQSMIPSFETWDFTDFIAFERRLKGISEQIRLISVEAAAMPVLFDALVFRMLCQGCFAADLKEQVFVQKSLNTILHADAYNALVQGLSRPVQELLCENALRKIECCSFETLDSFTLSAFELALLEQGPFEQFYAKSLSVGQHTRIRMVLLKLVHAESAKPEANRPLTAIYKARTAQDSSQFERMLASYTSLGQGTLGNF